MNPWDVLRRVAADRTSGATDLALRTAQAVAALDDDREILRASRRLLDVHGAMGVLWRVFDAALTGPDSLERLRVRIVDERDAVARSAQWALTRRVTVLTHSSSSSVRAALRRAGRRVREVVCTASLPGGEGRMFAARLRRDGFETRVVADAAIAAACGGCDVVIVGADAVTPSGVVNKVGTMLCALAAREHAVACYALAGSTKQAPSAIFDAAPSAAFEQTPLTLFDAVIGERGPLGPASVRRAAGRVRLDPRLLRAVR